MNLGLILAIVVAILASAIRSKKQMQGHYEEVQPIDSESEWSDRSIEVPDTDQPTQPRQLFPPKQGSRMPRRTKIAANHHFKPSKAPFGVPTHNERIPQPETKHTQQSPESTGTEPQHELIRDFDPQKAILYTEIMKPKFEEYE